MLMSAGATPGVSDSRLGVSDSRPAMLSVAISQERLAVGVRSGGRSGDAPRPGQRRATDLAAGALACPRRPARCRPAWPARTPGPV